MHVLTLNAGSSSLKFEAVGIPDRHNGESILWGTSLLSGPYENIGKDSAAFSLPEHKKATHTENVILIDHEHAASLLFDCIEQGNASANGIRSLKEIDRIAHRVVHGADQFAQATFITDTVVDQITALDDLVPLHNEPPRKIIKVAQGSIRVLDVCHLRYGLSSLDAG
jgi:acetate kinase